MQKRFEEKLTGNEKWKILFIKHKNSVEIRYFIIDAMWIE